MEIFIVSIGNEILEGSILDTNSNYLARRLKEEGFSVSGIFAVGDSLNELEQLLSQLMRKEAIIITTGGLGPTFDDKTTQAVSKACKKRLKLNKSVYFDILSKVKAKGVKLKTSHTRQAYLPEGAKILPNHNGTAAGIFLKCNQSYFICMPGVPSEMKPMFENYAIKNIKEIIKPIKLYRCDFKLIGVPESDADEFLKRTNTQNIKIILNAMEGELAIRTLSEDKDILEDLKKNLFEKFGYKLYSTKNQTIEDVLSEELEKEDLTIAFLESITAGYLALLMFDKAPFIGSFVSDANIRIDDAFEKADIVACPCNLVGNEFDLHLRINSDEITQTLRYMGNINFMRKSISKRTLGFIYETLKSS
ncbi:competence/damage-inducible protein A [Hippea maritima]|uniref:Molybdopterin binding domain protein n=1 Tax=Hippea maritima (strain ATCC 700847 / DSM 10411 / MH2) TaxID=760142 RepID=F2LV01_HIPMA|nr:competence/damage-inducible protein A [Hippea maritima]AEA33585.1 molybdopterin binding domain protein [Hippea maritima DSM 10411]